MIASVLALVATPAGALASANMVASVRLSGADRYATANYAADSTKAVNDESHFVLANGNSYADGLSAAALAGALDTDGAAMLLTDGTTITSSALTTMIRMSGTINVGLKYVHLVGGTSAISAGIATQLAASGFVVKRISGADRYATADAVAAEVKAQNGGNIGTFGGYRTAFLVNGNGFADAIAASGIAYDNKLPIYLTDGSTLSAGTSASMKTNKIQKVIVLGGTAAIAETVKAAALAVSTVVTTQRISGADRYETATALATAVAAVDTARRVKVVLVDGTNFPDGLAAGQYAASINATILLVNGSTLPATVSTWITGKQAYVNQINAVGGTAAVPAAALTAAKTAGTKPGITATISKITDKGTVARVTFSERVNAANAQTEANYVTTTKFGVAAAWATDACTYTWTAATSSSVVNCTGGTAMAPGSTFTVVGNTIAGYADADVKVTTNSYTQAANGTAPTATIHAIAAAAGTTDKVWVTFSMAPTGFTNADITATNQVSGAAAAVIDGCATFTTTIYACNVATNALAAGDQVKIAAGSFTSGATLGVKNATAYTAIAATDIVKPLLSTATFTTPVADTAAGSQANLRVIGAGTALSGASGAGAVDGDVGDVTITALATGAYAGKAGNTVKVVVVSNATVACTFVAATKTITVTAAAATMAPIVTDACNANAAFAASFVAATKTGITVFGMTGLAATTSRVTNLLTGGKNKSTLTLTFSEPLSIFVVGDMKVSTSCATTCVDTVAAATEAVDTTGTNGLEVNQEAAGVIKIKAVFAGTLSAGLDKVTLTATTLDRNGNALSVAGTTHVVLMQLG
jgi:putative cell wall-binding protein